MKQHADEVIDQEVANERWENEGGHTESARAAEEVMHGPDGRTLCRLNPGVSNQAGTPSEAAASDLMTFESR